MTSKKIIELRYKLELRKMQNENAYLKKQAQYQENRKETKGTVTLRRKAA